MDSQILIVILTSSLVASVVAVLLRSFLESITARKRNEEEQNRKLYGPVKFHLLFMDTSAKTKTELLKEADKIYRTASDKLELPFFQKEDINSLIKIYWTHLYAIMNILESNPGCIKKEHIPLIKNLIEGYIKRKIVGKEIIKGTRSVPEEWITKIIDAVDALKEKLLK